jgi:subtilisin family serine protease
MKSMTDFADLLKNAKRDKSAENVKIAIIDDGINMALSAFADNVKGGESFYRLSELSGRRGAYYAPTGPHGTMMAQLICEVCPVADLYIAQLELLPGQDGQRSFTAESATEVRRDFKFVYRTDRLTGPQAINWAITKDVDIISMSWSINTSRNLSRLTAALELATKEKIIMFCASIDEGATTYDNTYPGNWKSCIKIGACTGTGAKLSWVSEFHSDFLLPGEVPQSASEPNLWNNPHMGSFGSSVSTALAAGLAGVLLYCDRLAGTPKVEPELDPSESEEASTAQDLRKVDYLRNMKNIDTAFDFLSRGTENNKVPQVWDHLPKDLKWSKKAWPEETDQAIERLKEFMRGLRIPSTFRQD